MLRFYNPTKGTISIDGYDLRDLSPLSFRKRIGIVAQDTQLFNATILENIAYVSRFILSFSLTLPLDTELRTIPPRTW